MKWEYSTVIFDTVGWFVARGDFDGEKFNDKLNSYGADGWELVNVFDTNMREGGTRNVVAVFKRAAK